MYSVLLDLYSVALAQPFFDLVQFAPDFSGNIAQQKQGNAQVSLRAQFKFVHQGRKQCGKCVCHKLE